MVQLTSLTTAFVSALLLGQSLAHPGMSAAEMEKEIAERSAYLKTAKRDLSHCAAKMKARGLEKRGTDRRTEKVAALRAEVAAKKRWNDNGGQQHGGQGGWGGRTTWGKGHTPSTRPGQPGHPASSAHGQPGHSVSSAHAHSTATHESSVRTTAHGHSTETESATVASHKSSASSVESASHKSSATSVESATVRSSASSASVESSASSASSASVASIKSTTLTTSASSPSSTSSIVAATSSYTASTTGVSGASTITTSIATFTSSAGGGFSGNGTMTGGPGGNGTMSGMSGGGGGTMTGSGGAGGLATSVGAWESYVASESHEFSNLTGITASTSGVEEIIFGNHSCILNPEGEVGPFYVTGEYIRSDIVDGQDGVPVTIDGQFIDINTCEPIVGTYWDIWHANSTGVYGGVIGNGNGNSADTGNLNNTFLRGLQPTDSDGVAQFESVFPGHYAGRATHIHVVSHIGGTVLSNGTYTGGDITHVGQLFFDQSLITTINTNYTPYSENTIAIVDNIDDRVFAEETLTDSDPVFDYVLLGDDVSDGLFMWITMGIDPTASYSASAAAYYGENGGVLE